MRWTFDKFYWGGHSGKRSSRGLNPDRDGDVESELAVTTHSGDKGTEMQMVPL
jgi:hypothetical protein